MSASASTSVGGAGGGDEAMDVVIVSGYLAKVGQRRKSWKRRWFVLTDQSLTYYVEDTLLSWKGTIWVDDFVSVGMDESQDKPNCIALELPNRTHYLVAESAATAEAWLNHLQALIDNKPPLSMLSASRKRLATGGEDDPDAAHSSDDDDDAA